MATRRLLFISSLLLALVVSAQEADSLKIDSLVVAQEVLLDSASSDSTTTAIASADTVKIVRKFLTIGPYIDLTKLFTIPTDFETKYELGLELRFSERFSLYGEWGSATTTPEEAYTNGIYESSGTYYRLGLGYVGQLDPKHDIGISFRYGASTFDEDVRIFINSPSEVQGPFNRNVVDRSDLTANWWEVVLYSDQQLLQNSELFWLGFNLRLRILDSYDAQDVPDVYAIPGYGRSFDKTIPAINFFLKVKI